MLELDDPRWKSLTNAYGEPYDASVVLKRLQQGEDVWEELWDELHHQGSLGTSSYAAAPHIVQAAIQMHQADWNPYALVAIIEVERQRNSNPALPSWAASSYHKAIQDLANLALTELGTLTDELLVRSALGIVALARGATRLGTLITLVEKSEINEILEEMFGNTDGQA